MFEYIKGEIQEITPDHLIMDNKGVGYYIHISLHSYETYQKQKPNLFYIHQSIKEDAHTLYGFTTKLERELFRKLISVSGIGTNTARLMLSSLSPKELSEAIALENVGIIKAIKGIGPKTAQRVILDLKDKVSGLGISIENTESSNNNSANEAFSALQALGFQKMQVHKVVNKILSEDPTLGVEGVIKQALKLL